MQPSIPNSVRAVQVVLALRILASLQPSRQDDFSETLTASFDIWDNLLTRVEYRADVVSAGTTGTGDSTVQNEISLEAVYSF